MIYTAGILVIVAVAAAGVFLVTQFIKDYREAKEND